MSATAIALPILAVLGPAWAGRPPPDYRTELMDRVANDVDALIARGAYDEAITFASDFQKDVEPAARVTYEQALAHRFRGDDDEAFALYTRAIELDPSVTGAWYDRGELRLIQGQDREAEADFREAARLAPDTWVVHFRLADMAGRREEPIEFEQELLLALRHGFDPHVIAEDPNWHRYARHSRLGEVLTRLLTLYSDESLVEKLRQPVAGEEAR